MCVPEREKWKLNALKKRKELKKKEEKVHKNDSKLVCQGFSFSLI